MGYWQTASKMIAARPVSGHGTATFADRQMTFRPASATPAKHAHNDYLEIFAENGIVGFALFAVFLLGLFLSSRPASVGEEEETPESTGKAFEVQSEAPGTRVKPPVRAAILAAILCWVALSVALAMFGAADFDNLLAHVTEGSLAWAVLLVCTVLLPPAATYALARFYMPERHSVALRYGIFSSAVGFLAHSLIDFNLYNQGASLAFFALAGILSGPVHVFKGVSRFTVVMLAGTVVMFFASVFFSGQLGEVSRMNSLSSAVTEGNAKLSPQQLKMLHDMLADPPEPLLIDLADLYAERGYVAGLFAAEREEFASVALANYENAILLNPYRHRYPLEVAVMLGHLEQYELSQEYFEKAAELAPNSVRVLREYAVMLDKSGRKARASELLERADSLERLRMELEGVSAD
ncbi:MAG: O-antigen ligase family protein [Planctomycetota bacterium]|nr:O-antigen ligase family protein [Planctomycetota bacterium]